MGRSYWFECARCGYRTRVAGQPDRGVDFCVSTILCRDCKELYDAVVRIRWPGRPARRIRAVGSLVRGRFDNDHVTPRVPPSFQAALSRLRVANAGRSWWISFPVQCPVSPAHRVQTWNDPDKCPRCGIFLERSALPYRIWD